MVLDTGWCHIHVHTALMNSQTMNLWIHTNGPQFAGHHWHINKPNIAYQFIGRCCMTFLFSPSFDNRHGEGVWSGPSMWPLHLGHDILWEVKDTHQVMGLPLSQVSCHTCEHLAQQSLWREINTLQITALCIKNVLEIECSLWDYSIYFIKRKCVIFSLKTKC